MTAEAEKAPKGSQLEQLRAMTKVVADTGEIEAIRRFRPSDATTNPTLIYKAVQKEAYSELLEKAVAESEGHGLHRGSGLVARIMDDLLVLFGCEILEIIDGRVSTEVNARLSFDTEGTLEKARSLVKLYEEQGVGRERVLIKIASTWEGVQAAKVLENEGIHCNMTLLFSLPQAVACAEADATLISPFVGRILDWYKEKTGHDYGSSDDPGVESVQTIYNYLKKYDYKTEVMGASFRNKGEIVELAGCDLLTISPGLLGELSESTEVVERKLSPENARHSNVQRMELSEKDFRWHLNSDPMATEKLAEGIRRFHEDAVKLEQLIEKELLED